MRSLGEDQQRVQWKLIANLAEASTIAFQRATKFNVAVIILHHVL